MTQQANPVNVTVQTTGAGTIKFDIRIDKFNELIEERGLFMLHEQTINCPCRNEISGAPLSNCVNCNGIGMVFLNPAKIKGVITQIGRKKNFAQQGENDPRDSQLITKFVDRVAWMDRITLQDGEGTYFENIYPRLRKVGSVQKLAAILQYTPINITSCLLYINPTTAFQNLVQGTDYFITNSRIFFLSDALQAAVDATAEKKYYISLRYTHLPVYFVMEVDHDIRNQRVRVQGQTDKVGNLPVHCNIRKAHYVTDGVKFNT